MAVAACMLWMGAPWLSHIHAVTAYVPGYRYRCELPGRREIAFGGVAGIISLPQLAWGEASTLPSWIKEFEPYPEGYFGSGAKVSDPVLRWEPLGQKVEGAGSSLKYPAWLSGTWEVQYKSQERHLPAGAVVGGAFSAAGIDKGSILRLLDVRAEPTAYWRFSMNEDGESTRADWNYTLSSLIPAFWEGAEIVSIKEGMTPDGPGLAAVYKTAEGFFGGGPFKIHGANLAWLAGETWQDPTSNTVLSMEWQRQRGEVLNPKDVYDYKILTRLRLVGEGQVKGLVRIATFLQPSDSSYEDADGRPAVVHESLVTLKLVK